MLRLLTSTGCLVLLAACEPEVDGPAGVTRLVLDNQTALPLEVRMMVDSDWEGFACAPRARCSVGEVAEFGTTPLPAEAFSAVIALEDDGIGTGREVFRLDPNVNERWTVDGAPVTDALRPCCANLEAVLTVTSADLQQP